ncbi:MAG: hypothetical protein GWP14_06750 [Actinobacteria bacterium]|nr:hypothetical protein [Actinomycetota bacterium]
MSTDKPIRFFGVLVTALAVMGLLTAAQAYGQTTTVVIQKPKPTASGWLSTDRRITYPSVGEITAENVLIRAGGNLNYYVCGKLAAGSTVVVREEQYGWLKIDPPKGCFSLIAADYVQKSAGSDQGIVNATVVRVRAGAIDSEQNYAVQCRLNTGDKVQILGEVTSEVLGKKVRFYKIVPPAGKAFLWVSSPYVRYVGPYDPSQKMVEEEPIVPDFPKPEPKEAEALPKSADRQELEKLDEALRIEMRRPIAQRELAEHLAKYLALRTKTEDATISELAKERIVEIRRYIEIQTALQKSKDIRKDYESSKERMAELYKTVSTAEIKADEKITQQTGLLKPSYAFRSRGVKRWRLVDPSTRRNICYLLAGKVAEEELRNNEGKIVVVSGPTVFDRRVALELIMVNSIETEGK